MIFIASSRRMSESFYIFDTFDFRQFNSKSAETIFSTSISSRRFAYDSKASDGPFSRLCTAKLIRFGCHQCLPTICYKTKFRFTANLICWRAPNCFDTGHLFGALATNKIWFLFDSMYQKTSEIDPKNSIIRLMEYALLLILMKEMRLVCRCSVHIWWLRARNVKCNPSQCKRSVGRSDGAANWCRDGLCRKWNANMRVVRSAVGTQYNKSKAISTFNVQIIYQFN